MVPSLKDVPDRFDTARLTIRCPRPGDGALVFAAVRASLASLREFPASLPWAMAEPSIETSEQFCREGQAHYQLRSMLPMLLFLKGSDTLVGCSGLHAFDWDVPKCEIGYWGHVGFRGQGLVTEAVRAITQFGLATLGMRRIEALPDPGNRASCAVCERAGYVLEGTLRNDRIAPGGELRDTCVYAVVG